MKAGSEEVQDSEEISGVKLHQRTRTFKAGMGERVKRRIGEGMKNLVSPLLLIGDLIGGVNAVFILINLIIWQLYRRGIFFMK